MNLFSRPSLALAGALFAVHATAARAAVRLPALFSDHMVLQCGMPAPVWGWAEPGEKVSVGIAGQARTARTGADGRWKATLDPIPAGGPYTLVVSGTNEIRVSDVLAGEVWIGSGQSNMGFRFKWDFYPYLKVRDYEKEKAAADFPRMRMFLVTGTGTADKPKEDCRGRWYVTSPRTVDAFSAELYFFGRELHQTLGVPVGLIKSAVGGTAIDLWIDANAQEAVPELKGLIEAGGKERAAFDPVAAEARYKSELAEWGKEADEAKAAGRPPPRRPSDPVSLHRRNANPGGLFNSCIAPLIPYAIRGVVWHQGEADAGDAARASYYRYELPLLVADWRRRWGHDFPFAWVQLANLGATRNDGRTLVREAMLDALRLPDTGMAVTIDIGETHNVHFIDKQDVGHRLAMWALGSVYGRGCPTSGPLPAGCARRGSGLVLSFTHTDGGLAARGGDPRGFEIRGAGGPWRSARARIEGACVIVSSPEVGDPVAARYAWASDPDCNLCNGAGLPASPFRTDEKQ